MYTVFYIKTTKTMRTHEGEIMDFGEEYVNVEESVQRGKIYDSISAERGSSFSNEKDAQDAITKLSAVDQTKLGTILHTFKVEAIDYEFANLQMFSDCKPFEIVRVVSDKTIEVRPMIAERDEDFAPEFVPGGFAGHCINQGEQTWIYRSAPEAEVVRMRLGKKGWKSCYGRHTLSQEPYKFHDYNF